MLSKKHSGFTLIEIFISLAIGLVLFAGVMSIFVGLRTTTAETSSYGAVQENGRFAISMLSNDLMMQNFWGDYPGTLDATNLMAASPGAPVGECTGGGSNNGSFPSAVGHFRTLWGMTATQASHMGCITDAKVNSDIIQLKRVTAFPLPSVPPALPVAPAGNYYFTSNLTTAAFFLGGGATPNIENSNTWQYRHHVYYVREESVGTETVPVLMRRQLTTTMTGAPVIDGIEVIRFMYGVDSDDDGVVNAFISADNVSDLFWNNGNSTNILAVKIYVLARDVHPDRKYENKNTYQLGDLALTFNDNYRRLLFSSTVTLFNARVDEWPP
ncbi:prepilin-type N-terminal cleavage/methylation domain-containing protein [Thalassotalea sp. M1531]|uniref:Prepilin-type N-terminal cleavage/methylation domain-containing protein n=1 Tax=Thalassotalea algicola TaxID=2716224 RepID=A0A7Y0LB39_9GAMM|nr:PilW family protein [Thalassotalea algicola]NMP30938.1 prepilin-type N-terminal cleavage/methylation domain-containing protein [Thalassotalea algicola]